MKRHVMTRILSALLVVSMLGSCAPLKELAGGDTTVQVHAADGGGDSAVEQVDGTIDDYIIPNGYVELVGKRSYKMNVHISVILYNNRTDNGLPEGVFFLSGECCVNLFPRLRKQILHRGQRIFRLGRRGLNIFEFLLETRVFVAVLFFVNQVFHEQVIQFFDFTLNLGRFFFGIPFRLSCGSDIVTHYKIKHDRPQVVK